MAGKQHYYGALCVAQSTVEPLTDRRTDEPRRSGRATKGQYTKDRDIQEGAPKKKGKGNGSKAKAVEEEEEGDEEGEEIIRCVCGTYEEEEDVPRAMICCDRCEAWQHNSCMGLEEDYQPETYFCEQCKPEDHKELIAAMARGERPWDEAIRRFEERTAKKKGKKGRKSGGARTSEVAPKASQEPKDQTPQPAATGQKRKLEESPSVPELKNKKARGTPAADTNGAKAATPARKPSETPSRTASKSEYPVVTDVKELANSSRRQAASTLIKLMEGQIKEASKQGEYTAPSGSSAQAISSGIGLRLESALYHIHAGGAGEPNEAYKNQLRSIPFNLKKNHALAVRLLSGDLSPEELAGMDPKDMASEEQKKKDAATMKELEKQHTIVEEQGPRIRRTHKGEEYVDESRQVAAESQTSNAPVRRPSGIEQPDAESKSPVIKSPSEIPGAGRTRSKPSLDTKRQSSANFDIDKVWSNVQGSPDADGHRFGDLPKQSPGMAVREPMGPGAKADADIDELLKDEEAESPPYSPKESAEADGVIWRGTINGGNLGRFRATARHAAGATPDSDTLRMTYRDVLPQEIAIGGRIQPPKADEYLCGLEYSNTSDLVIVYMPEPQNSPDQEEFDKFFRYFKGKDRFGVGVQHHNAAIKDIYLIPLNEGQELPTFVKKLETDFPDPARERMLLVPIVIKNSELPHMQGANLDGTPTAASPSSRGHAVAQTPITPHEGSFEPPQSGGVYSQSPAPAQGQYGGANGAPSQMMPNPGFAPPPGQPYPGYGQPQPSQPQQQQQPQSPATMTAQKILGPLASSPAVVQLCAQAPNAGEIEFKIIKECIEKNPEAANRLDVLTTMLQESSIAAGGQGGGI
ncbi:Transcription factor bye1 [Exophiala xenobiotica]|nr:Transcription factor bye1 [Exophiala xenobiotica]KAK5205665.1 Transcription factor bye1 [Exophiala xenobiotica]KAK5223500.1 Transcription factor bye1 [Exophiala xenobiotica]KAK5418380.1 Transcription factor bye1 [Exophiala xenobiotica]